MPQDFALYPQARTSIAALRGLADGFPSEEHRLDLDTTENPVESGSTLTDNAVERRKRLRLEMWVSDVLAAPGSSVSPTRPAEAWAIISDLFANRSPVTVTTALQVYTDMLIVRAVAPRNRQTGGSLRVTMDLAQVLFADTDLARFPPARVDPDGPAADRTSQVDGGDRSSPAVAPLPSSVLETFELS